MRRMIPKLILVPVDFSANSERALDYACELAAKLGSTVRMVHAFASPPSALRIALTEDILENLVNEHKAGLGKLAAARSGSASFGEPIVEVGDPRDAIVQTAEKLGADLIVMGTQGRRGLSRVMMGSVAEDVIRQAPCPVLAVRAKREG